MAVSTFLLFPAYHFEDGQSLNWPELIHLLIFENIDNTAKVW